MDIYTMRICKEITSFPHYESKDLTVSNENNLSQAKVVYNLVMQENFFNDLVNNFLLETSEMSEISECCPNSFLEIRYVYNGQRIQLFIIAGEEESDEKQQKDFHLNQIFDRSFPNEYWWKDCKNINPGLDQYNSNHTFYFSRLYRRIKHETLYSGRVLSYRILSKHPLREFRVPDILQDTTSQLQRVDADYCYPYTLPVIEKLHDRIHYLQSLCSGNASDSTPLVWGMRFFQCPQFLFQKQMEYLQLLFEFANQDSDVSLTDKGRQNIIEFTELYQQRNILIDCYAVGNNSSDVQRVANAFASDFGGQSSFYVTSPESTRYLNLKGEDVCKINCNPIPSIYNLSSIAHALKSVSEQKLNKQAIEKFKQTFFTSKPSQSCIFDIIRDGINKKMSFLSCLTHIYSPEEAFSLFRLPYVITSLPGVESHRILPFNIPSQSMQANNSSDCFTIGPYIVDGREVERQHTIFMNSLTKHVFLTGGSGSGKTEAALKIVHSLIKKNIPVMIVEPAVKTEYAERLKQADVKNLVVSHFDFDSLKDDTKPEREPMAFDPMWLPYEVSPQTHASYLVEAFSAGMPINELGLSVFEGGLREYYEVINAGGYPLSKYFWIRVNCENESIKIIPSFSHFSEWFLDSYLSRNFSDDQKNLNDWKAVFRRRFDNLLRGPLGKAMNNAYTILKSKFFGNTWQNLIKKAKTDKIKAAKSELKKIMNEKLKDKTKVPEIQAIKSEAIRIVTANYENKFLSYSYPKEYLTACHSFENYFANREKNWIIELSALGSQDQIALMTAYLFIFVFEYCRKTGSSNGNLKVFALFEEAHRVLGNPQSSRSSDFAGASAQQKSIAFFAQMIAEIRSFGVGLGVVEQSPSKIIADVIKNTALKVMLRLPAADDRAYLGGTMNLTQEQQIFAIGLKPGEAIVFDESLDEPVMCKFKKIDNDEA